MTNFFRTLIALSFPILLIGQTDFNYSLSLEPVDMPNLDGIHSYAFAQHDGKWLIIGGRLDGIHPRQPWASFPASQNNTDLRVVDPESGEVWSASVSALPTALGEQLQATNFEFFQDGDWLLIAGGYAFSATEDDHVTFPHLVLVNVPELISDIMDGTDISENFQQITDDAFAVTGGYFGKIGDTFYLVGGHRFDGRYNPMNMPTFTQTYTNAIRKFTLENDNGTWSFDNYEVISDPVHLHRRDYNLLPQIYPNGEFGYTIFSGVFQLNADLPFLYPVDITEAGYEPMTTFNQYLSNYHSACLALHDAEANAMHNLFFGGISQYYYDGSNMVQDDDVPFVKTISRVSRDADGNLEEKRLPLEMPGYLGASGEFIISPDLPMAGNDIIELSEITEDSFLLGHIVGGLDSPVRHAFAFNNTEVTEANTTVFKVYLKKEMASATGEKTLPGYHDFSISVSPNPVDSSVFYLTIKTPEAGDLEIFLSDLSGVLILNEEIKGAPVGENTLEVEMDTQVHGMSILTVVLNGKYSATEKMVFH